MVVCVLPELYTQRDEVSRSRWWCWSSDVVLLMLSRPTRAATSVIWLKLHAALSHLRTSLPYLGIKALLGQPSNLRATPTASTLILFCIAMEYFSLKRSTAADRGQSNLSSKVYVRSTKSGKVQKIVRELYLRQDIPCSSNLCRACLEIAPTDYSKKGKMDNTLRKSS
jgi:hypothetical protein